MFFLSLYLIQLFRKKRMVNVQTLDCLLNDKHICAHILPPPPPPGGRVERRGRRAKESYGVKSSLTAKLVSKIQRNGLLYAFNVPPAAKLLQLCPTLCDPIDGSPPGSPVPGILQARTLEWAAISFSNTCKWKVKVKLLSCVWLLATPWTAAHQAPPSMGFSRQEYWSGVPLSSPNVPPSYNQIPV